MSPFGENAMAKAFKKASQEAGQDNALGKTVKKITAREEKVEKHNARRKEERKNFRSKRLEERRRKQKAGRERQQRYEERKQELSEKAKEFLMDNPHYTALLGMQSEMRYLKQDMNHFGIKDDAEVRQLLQGAFDSLIAAKNNMFVKTEKALQTEAGIDDSTVREMQTEYTDIIKNISTPVKQIESELRRAHRDVDGYPRMRDTVSNMVARIERSS